MEDLQSDRLFRRLVHQEHAEVLQIVLYEPLLEAHGSENPKY